MGLTNNLGKLSNMITSTGSAVGIGTSSPQSGYILDVKGFSQFGNSVYPNVIRLGDQDTNSTIIQSVSTAGVAKDLTFWNTSERMRITATGKVGIGTTTPSNTYQGLTIYGTDPSLSLQTSNSGGWCWTQYVNSSGTTNFSMGVNQSLPFWGVKVGAGMDNPAFAIVSSGNVGIGTTSPASILDIGGASGNPTLRLNGATSSSPTIRFDQNSSAKAWMYLTSSGTLQINTTASDGQGIAIDSSNNVGIGTSSPQRALDIRGGSAAASHRLQLYNNYSNVYMQLYTGGDGQTGLFSNSFMTFNIGSSVTEAMRITSGGELLVGTSSSAWASGGRGIIEVRGSSTALVGLKYGSSTGGYVYHNGVDMYINNDQPNRLYCISNSGGVYLSAGATSWTANSDERLKHITGNIEKAIDSLLTLRTVKHTWKSDNTNKEYLALIAQDVEKVFPQVIDKSKLPSKPNESQSDETEYLGVRYQELVPVLVKAIQELKTEIDELKNK